MPLNGLKHNLNTNRCSEVSQIPVVSEESMNFTIMLIYATVIFLFDRKSVITYCFGCLCKHFSYFADMRRGTLFYAIMAKTWSFNTLRPMGIIWGLCCTSKPSPISKIFYSCSFTMQWNTFKTQTDRFEEKVFF